MHLKRHKVPKNWPIPRKGTKYVVKSRFNLEKAIPILVILRDILKIARNRKEVKRALYLKHILLNNKVVRDEKHSALLFDTITIVPAEKYYRVELSDNGKFKIAEIQKSDADKKVSKVVNKKILKGRKTQLNLSDGRNMLSDLKCNINDSVVINFSQNKIEKCLSLKEKAKVIVIAGKHAGETGIIKSIKPRRKMVGLNVDGKEINVLIKQLMVVE